VLKLFLPGAQQHLSDAFALDRCLHHTTFVHIDAAQHTSIASDALQCVHNRPIAWNTLQSTTSAHQSSQARTLDIGSRIGRTHGANWYPEADGFELVVAELVRDFRTDLPFGWDELDAEHDFGLTRTLSDESSRHQGEPPRRLDVGVAQQRTHTHQGASNLLAREVVAVVHIDLYQRVGVMVLLYM
jgi:hypothetical protein